MRVISLLALLLMKQASLQAQPIGPQTHTILFLGNSITYAGGYIEDVEAWYLTRHPRHNIAFIDLGLPSETVSGLSEPGHADGRFPRPDLHERLRRVLEKVHPEVIFACYGMNDGIYLPFDQGRFEKYKAGMQWLHDTLAQATGARVIFLTPPAYDELHGGKVGYADVIDRYSQWLLDQRGKAQWEVADIHFPMKKYLEARRKTDTVFALATDGVHPGELGHWLMAKPILLHIGEKAATHYPGINAAMAPIPHGDSILQLIRERQYFMKDAWLTFTKHTRPDMPVGLPMEEAGSKSGPIARKLRALLGD